MTFYTKPRKDKIPEGEHCKQLAGNVKAHLIYIRFFPTNALGMFGHTT